jgi:phosphoribulokinase
MKRGYTPEQVLAELQQREPDSEAFIRPQRQWSDIVVSFYPPREDAEETNSHLNVRLVLRPTIPHPDFTEIIQSNRADYTSPIRLELDRDMGKPVDVLEIDGHATKEDVIHLERMLCGEIPSLIPFCSTDSNPEIGKLVGTTGETLQSYPLALTQLVISYHMLKAARIA